MNSPKYVQVYLDSQKVLVQVNWGGTQYIQTGEHQTSIREWRFLTGVEGGRGRCLNPTFMNRPRLSLQIKLMWTPPIEGNILDTTDGLYVADSVSNGMGEEGGRVRGREGERGEVGGFGLGSRLQYKKDRDNFAESKTCKWVTARAFPSVCLNLRVFLKKKENLFK